MVERIFVEKKPGYDVAAKKVLADVRGALGIAARDVRVFIRYDVEDLDAETMRQARTTIFSESPVDEVYDAMPQADGYRAFVVEYLPGQYDQRADSAMQCVQLLSMGRRPEIRCATVYAVAGVDDAQLNEIGRAHV